jgi:hypothetical protein
MIEGLFGNHCPGRALTVAAPMRFQSRDRKGAAGTVCFGRPLTALKDTRPGGLSRNKRHAAFSFMGGAY